MYVVELSAEIAAAAGATVIRHTKNQGKGEALNTAFTAARKLNAEILVLLDGDGKKLGQEVGYDGHGPKPVIAMIEKWKKP